MEDEEGEDEEGRPLPKVVRFTEAHRLAHLVHAIDSEVSVVPRGAYVATATHYVVRNAAYEGACKPKDPSVGWECVGGSVGGRVGVVG